MSESISSNDAKDREWGLTRVNCTRLKRDVEAAAMIAMQRTKEQMSRQYTMMREICEQNEVNAKEIKSRATDARTTESELREKLEEALDRERLLDVDMQAKGRALETAHEEIARLNNILERAEEKHGNEEDELNYTREQIRNLTKRVDELAQSNLAKAAQLEAAHEKHKQLVTAAKIAAQAHDDKVKASLQDMASAMQEVDRLRGGESLTLTLTINLTITLPNPNPNHNEFNQDVNSGVRARNLSNGCSQKSSYRKIHSRRVVTPLRMSMDPRSVA